MFPSDAFAIFAFPFFVVRAEHGGQDLHAVCCPAF